MSGDAWSLPPVVVENARAIAARALASRNTDFHREVGAYAAAQQIEALWAAGAHSASTAEPFAGARAFASVEALIAALGAAPPFASVLVKGSRFMAMERVVAALSGPATGDVHAA